MLEKERHEPDFELVDERSIVSVGDLLPICSGASETTNASRQSTALADAAEVKRIRGGAERCARGQSSPHLGWHAIRDEPGRQRSAKRAIAARRGGAHRAGR